MGGIVRMWKMKKKMSRWKSEIAELLDWQFVRKPTGHGSSRSSGAPERKRKLQRRSRQRYVGSWDEKPL